MTHSRSSPRRILYVSTLKEFCEHANHGDLDRGAIWAVELDPSSGLVLRAARLAEGLLDPQGIDWANNTLIIATSGRGTDGRGNCVLRIRNVDELAETVLADSGATLQSDDVRIEDVLCGFTRIQAEGHSKGHAWRSLRATADSAHVLVQIGSDCNWAADCLPDEPAKNEQLNFLLVEVASGRYRTVGTGARNAVGMHVDRNGHLLWIDNGSDDEEGMPGAPKGGTGNHGNRPDGELNVLYIMSSPKNDMGAIEWRSA